jgi:tetratricopeptide (TPR) repeat protein
MPSVKCPRCVLIPAVVALSMLAGCQALDRQVPRRPDGRVATVDRAHTGRAPAVSMGGSGSERPAGGSSARPRPASEVGVRAPASTPDQVAVARAETLRDQGFLDQALAEFEKAIEINPKLTVAYLGAGDIYRLRGDYEAAERNYRQAAELTPRDFQAQYLHGLSLQLLGRYSDAARAYLRALELRRDDFQANLNLATTYLQLGEPAEGLPYGQRAVQLNPKSPDARINLGAVYSMLDRHAEAVVEYQQAAELTELTGPLLLNLANSLGRVGRYEEMVNTLEQLARTAPTAAGYERLGAGLFKLRRYDESLSAFRKSVEIDPNHYPAHNGIGVCLLNQWEWSKQTDETARKEALAALRRSLHIEPSQPIILEWVGRYR